MELTKINNDVISDTLKLIKEQTGLELELCDYFTGLNEHCGKQYFNIITNEPVFASKTYNTLIRLSENGIISKVEPNGAYRLAIFL